MSRRYRLVEKDGQIKVEPVAPTPAMVAASRRNGLKGGRPKGSGTGRQPGLKRHLTAEGDAFLADVRDLAGLKSHAEALDLLRVKLSGRILSVIRDKTT